jgi:hypothetical protein
MVLLRQVAGVFRGLIGPAVGIKLGMTDFFKSVRGPDGAGPSISRSQLSDEVGAKWSFAGSMGRTQVQLGCEGKAPPLGTTAAIF